MPDQAGICLHLTVSYYKEIAQIEILIDYPDDFHRLISTSAVLILPGKPLRGTLPLVHFCAVAGKIFVLHFPSKLPLSPIEITLLAQSVKIMPENQLLAQAPSTVTDTKPGGVDAPPERDVINELGYQPELKRTRSMYTVLFQSLAIAAVSHQSIGHF